MLFNLLPYLALAGLAAEAVTAKPHTPHGHGIARRHHRIRNNVSRRGDTEIGYVNGKKCRVRPAGQSSASSDSATVKPKEQPSVEEQQPSAKQQQPSADEQPSAVEQPSTVEQPSADEQPSATEPQPSATEEQASTEQPTADESALVNNQHNVADATTSEAPKTPETTAPGPTGGNGGKRGLIWPNGDGDRDIRKYISGSISWYWAWEHKASDWAKEAGLEFVPQFWGPGKYEQWNAQKANNWNGQKVSHVMFFNEPDLAGTAVASNVAPADAVSHWRNEMIPLRNQGIKIGSAAPAGADVNWIVDFEKACGGGADCKADFITIHVYVSDIEVFKKLVTDAYNLHGGRPIWVTEWACHDFGGGGGECKDPAGFVTQATQWMDGSNMVERYSLFGSIDNLHGVDTKCGLMNTSPPFEPTDLWNTYISV